LPRSAWNHVIQFGATPPLIDAAREPTMAVARESHAARETSTCLVRAATPSDMASVTAIYANFVETSTATFELTAPDEAEMLRRRQTALDRGLPYLVAELEGYVVGFCYASQFRAREGYRFTVEDSIYVRPDCIGHGVGKLLLSTLIEECSARGFHTMVACICGINPISVALHESQGFMSMGVLPEAGNKFGEWLRLLIMQRPLNGNQSIGDQRES
jgi:L-amino acid N-acyltransferase YncA